MPLGPVIRIVLRYVAGFLVARGLIDDNSGAFLATDPDVFDVIMVAVGALIAAGTEIYYRMAKRWGWHT